MAGSMWQPTLYVFTTELGEPCDPGNALRALKGAAKRAKLPSTVGLHTLRHSAAFVMLSAGRAAQGGLGDLRSRECRDHWRRLWPRLAWRVSWRTDSAQRRACI